MKTEAQSSKNKDDKTFFHHDVDPSSLRLTLRRLRLTRLCKVSQ